MFKKFAAALCLLSMPLMGESISGEYGITGFNPFTMESYQGKAVITERGDVFDITWNLRGAVYVGTGIRRGDDLSAVFKNLSNAAEVGAYTYHVNEDGTLAGKWVFLGRNKKGSETLKPIQQ